MTYFARADAGDGVSPLCDYQEDARAVRPYAIRVTCRENRVFKVLNFKDSKDSKVAKVAKDSKDSKVAKVLKVFKDPKDPTPSDGGRGGDKESKGRFGVEAAFDRVV